MSKRLLDARPGQMSAEHDAVLEILRLKGTVWHRTTVAALPSIMADGAIKPNAGLFPATFPQSKSSYATLLKAVALFDFENATDHAIDDRRYAWEPIVFDHRPGVLIEMDRSRLEEKSLLLASQITSNDPRTEAIEERLKHTIIPDVEALYLDDIPMETFNRFLVLDHSDDGVFRFQEFEVPAFEALMRLASTWHAENETLAAARHKVGQCTLAEVVERSLRNS